jgi:hypothetical protein
LHYKRGLKVTEKQIRDFQAGAVGAFKGIAALIIALGVVFGGVYYLFEPRMEEWLEDREAPVIGRLDNIEGKLSNIEIALRRNQINLIDFEGIGYVPDRDANYKPGDVVSIIYHLRRNFNCRTRVYARFIDGDTGLPYSPASYERMAERAPVTEELITFKVDIEIPEALPSGTWSYVPIIAPVEGCSNLTSQTVPPSEFFRVTAD